MNKEELLKAIEQKRQAIWPTDTGEMAPANVPNNLEQGWLNALVWIERYIKSLPAEQPSEELEEAANKYADDNPSLCLENDGGIYEDFAAPRRNFIAGAQWQKEQMLKSAIKIDAKIVNDEMSGCVVDCEQGCLVLEPHRYPIGQKLKILILEDEQ